MHRLGRYAAMAAIGVTAAIAVLAVASNFLQPKSIDFLSYWAAARMMLVGDGTNVYDVEAHRAVELTAAPVRGLLPFPYPPAFLFVGAPFGLVPYVLAFPLWLGVTGLLFLISVRNRVAAAHPVAAANALVGQSGLLTTGIFALGTSLLARNPAAGGAVLGLLAIKPQLALLIPLALLAGREWRALAGAATAAVVITAVPALLFGPGMMLAWLRLLGEFAARLSGGAWPWAELASPYALFRSIGLDSSPALILHAMLAAFAIFAAWASWSRKLEARVPVLAAATLLVPPYLFTYDALLLAIPLAWLSARGHHPLVLSALWLLAALPVADHFGLYSGPNPIPLAAVMSIIQCLRYPPRQAGRIRSDDQQAGSDADRHANADDGK
jgi:hypothetical protein